MGKSKFFVAEVVLMFSIDSPAVIKHGWKIPEKMLFFLFFNGDTSMHGGFSMVILINIEGYLDLLDVRKIMLGMGEK